LVAAGADFLDPIRSLADDLSADDEEINLRTELKSPVRNVEGSEALAGGNPICRVSDGILSLTRGRL